ncbi:MAG: PhoH family protein [Leifsonia sp.]
MRQSKSEKRLKRHEVKTVIEEKKFKRPLVAKTKSQKTYLSYLNTHRQVFSVGPAGTGKTYIAARVALRKVLDGEFENLVIARPTVSSPKHKLGFLPGNADMKLKPWLVPLMASFKDEASGAEVDQLKNTGKIEFASFEHMRGRTFKDSVIILDEAQNCDFRDLKLFLTRIGENSLVIVNGDMDQVDIPDSGLERVVDMITRYKINAAVVFFDENDVVRSETAAEWVKAFSKVKT